MLAAELLELWRSYVAMANTRGGRLVLGVQERADGSLRAVGLREPERVRRDLWATLNNPQKVSACVVTDADVQIVALDGRHVLVVDVPRAPREVRPVYLNGNPFEVYLRRHEGDMLVRDRERVRRMIADAQYATRDDRVLDGFGADDVDPATLTAYRQRFRDRSPDHPWLDLDDAGLLRQLGAWRRDRETGASGLTLAGLLAFGSQDALRDARPGHLVDYQERSALGAQDWLDRVFPDGTWSGNLFDFYRRVMPRLTAGLKVPFALGPDLFRRSESHVHEALREALVNCLIHADHDATTTVVVVRAPEGFVFENPGLPRLPREQILQGGVSDCRNKTLQKIFLRVGLGEQAGSGYARILRAWREQHWGAPELVERFDAERTRLRLPLVSLFPDEVLDQLAVAVPDFATRDEIDRLILAVAASEGAVTNRGLQERCSAHGRDLTVRLRALVDEGVLTPHGERAGRSYTLSALSADHSSGSSSHSSGSSTHSPGSLSTQTTDELVRTVATSAWIARATAQAAVLRLCRDRWQTLGELAEALGRKPDTVHRSYLVPLVHEGRLARRFPQTPTHPDQAYRVAPPTDEPTE